MPHTQPHSHSWADIVGSHRRAEERLRRLPPAHGASDSLTRLPLARQSDQAPAPPGKQVAIRQKVPGGSSQPAGARIAITLGTATREKHA